MRIDTTYYERCIETLEKAYSLLLKADPDEIDYDMYRSASVKEFEIILEQSGKLLKKALKPYFHSTKAADQLYFKDIFRNAVLRSLIDAETCERWLKYRDNRNNTAHDYGVNFAEETLRILPEFIKDANHLASVIRESKGE
ncbi:nucleotidyltransferase substrate binding protein [Dyadobacter sp. Leaf189]|uniref:nucleotidyltransferase substrate binding protein n=1 Tax=Dyadobacter sp. Leaf189 TaxID=1736295 RepID=UPI0006FE4DD3|nr:nucleotidyltransferase substrate binding protein [Dyadobacter sp. Leaf189]KQS27993.1 nucleotidyltransferase [Dyadobacter sp. Leaf189]